MSTAETEGAITELHLAEKALRAGDKAKALNCVERARILISSATANGAAKKDHED